MLSRPIAAISDLPFYYSLDAGFSRPHRLYAGAWSASKRRRRFWGDCDTGKMMVEGAVCESLVVDTVRSRSLLSAMGMTHRAQLTV